MATVLYGHRVPIVMLSKINFPAIVVLVIVALGVVVTLWNISAPSSTSISTSISISPGGSLILPAFSPLAAGGIAAFDQNCASCHGASGTGSDQGPPLLHNIYNPGHHNDASFFRAAAQGTPRHHWNFGDMPPQPQVSRQDIIAIVRYIRELQEANGIVWQEHKM